MGGGGGRGVVVRIFLTLFISEFFSLYVYKVRNILTDDQLNLLHKTLQLIAL